MIKIDGSKGEGGGQILRSALSLSMTTGQPFQIENIRAGRNKPGLMRQHLTCVQAAIEVCGGHAQGAVIGSTALTFIPGDICGGHYAFSVGTAGSTGLVFQTVFPALLMADQPSNLVLTGGTHNPSAPAFEVITESFLPALARVGVVAIPQLISRGFYPAGGGEWHVTIQPNDLSQPVELIERGTLKSITAEAMVSNLPGTIAERELKVLQKKLMLTDDQLHVRTYKTLGPGNAVVVRLEFQNMNEVFVGFGEMGVTAEKVADRVASSVKRLLNSQAAIGHYLADQLLVPMALGAGGRFTMLRPSRHFETNCEVIRQFLDVRIDYTADDLGVWLVTVSR